MKPDDMTADPPEPPEVHVGSNRALQRLPGLFRRWEIEEILEPDAELYVEAAGATADGTDLYAVYWRDQRSAGTSEAA